MKPEEEKKLRKFMLTLQPMQVSGPKLIE